MIAIKENAHKYEAEIKLCFNLCKIFLKIHLTIVIKKDN